MTGWQDVRIEDLCVRVTSGGTPSRKRPDFYEGGTVPWVKSQELVEARVTAAEECITDAGLQGSSAKLLPADTVLMAMYGANVGQLGWLGIEAAVNQAVCAMVVDPTVTDPRFLYYALAGARGQLIAKAHGAAQQNLSQRLIRPFALRVPDVEVQRQIGDILRSMDDLIENNRRRVQVLEEMARAIYREWFVKFRYPGHESVPLVDSTPGPIPEGWQAKTISDLSSVVTRGIAPKYAEDGAWIVINQKCIRDERVSFNAARRQDRGVANSKQVRHGDVLINSTGVGTLGRVALYRGDGSDVTVDSHVTIARPSSSTLNPWFGMTLVTMRPHFERLGTGSTGQTELSRGDINEALMLLPVPDVLDEFSKAVWPLFEQADTLIAATESTAALRDLLLPKLVKGQIDVSSLDLDRMWGKTFA